MRFLFLSLAFLSLDFHLVAQNWQQISDFPGSARDDGASFTIGEIHYLGTGRSIDFSCTGDFYAYNAYLETWYPIAGLPQWQERQYASAFSFGQYGYLVGGENCNGFYFNTFWKYDPLSNQWQQMPALPAEGRAGCQSFMIGTDFFLIGGRNASGILDEVWCFHFDTQTWEQKNNLPFEGCWRGMSFVAGNTGYLAGGRTNANNQTGWNTQTWAYEPNTDTWSVLSMLDFGSKIYISTAVSDSLLFVFGGIDPADQVSSELMKVNLNTLQIDQLSPLSASARKGCMGFASNGYFFLSTGISGNDRLKETWRLGFLPNAIAPETDGFLVFQLLEGSKIMVRILPHWVGESIQLRDLQGHLLEKITLEQTEQIISLDGYPAGYYLIEVKGLTKPIRL